MIELLGVVVLVSVAWAWYKILSLGMSDSLMISIQLFNLAGIIGGSDIVMFVCVISSAIAIAMYTMFILKRRSDRK